MTIMFVIPTLNNEQKKIFFLHIGISTMHEFSCTRSTACVRVMCTIVTVHAICKGLKYVVLNVFIVNWSMFFLTGKRTSAGKSSDSHTS